MLRRKAHLCQNCYVVATLLGCYEPTCYYHGFHFKMKCEHIPSVELISGPRKRQNKNMLCVAFKSFEIELEDTSLCPLEYNSNRTSFRVLRILKITDLPFLPTLHIVCFRFIVICSYGVLSRWRFACAQTETDQQIFFLDIHQGTNMSYCIHNSSWFMHNSGLQNQIKFVNKL